MLCKHPLFFFFLALFIVVIQTSHRSGKTTNGKNHTGVKFAYKTDRKHHCNEKHNPEECIAVAPLFFDFFDPKRMHLQLTYHLLLDNQL